MLWKVGRREIVREEVEEGKSHGAAIPEPKACEAWPSAV
jgi:hypothetical protein